MPQVSCVLVADPLGAAGVERLRTEPGIDLRFADEAGRAELLEAVRDADALIVRSGTRADAELIKAAPRLKVIGRAGVGVDNIDLAEAGRRGIVVTNTPTASTSAAAELAFALMLAASRRVAAAHVSVAAGRWERTKFVGHRLDGRTLGLVGFGRIGQAVAVRAQAFLMTVVATDPFVTEDVARSRGVELMTLEELLAASDVISLHAALSPGAAPLLGEAEFAAMRPDAIVVNAARGALIDAAAARAALDNGRLAGMGVDVYEPEPPPSGHPLVGHPLVVHTPHLGASTFQSQSDVSLHVAHNVLAALRGDPVEHAVAPLP